MMMTTDYKFDLFRMMDKVGPIARSIAKSYNLGNDWEDVAQEARTTLLSRADDWKFADCITSEQYEKATIRNAVIDVCNRLANDKAFFYTRTSDSYNLDWLKLHIDALLAGMSPPTYQFVQDIRLGVEVNMVLSSGPNTSERADFEEAYALLTEHERDLFWIDRDTAGLRSEYSKALRKLNRKMNMIASERA